MRTTLNIDDDLLVAIKESARRPLGAWAQVRAGPLLPGGELRRRLEQDGHRMTFCDTFRIPTSSAEKHFDDDAQHSAFR